MKNKRVLEYEWVRIIATLLVVIGHSAYLFKTSESSWTIPENVNAVYYSGMFVFFRKMAGWVYGFHMPVFFMLSGAVLAIKPLKKFDDIIRARLCRLLVPYLVVGVFYMIPLKWIAGYYSGEMIGKVFKEFICGGEPGHLWFLPGLFFTTLICAVILKILERFQIKSNYLFLIMAGIIQMIYNFVPEDALLLRRGSNEGYIFWFAVGYCFEKMWRSKASNLTGKRKLLLFLCFSVIEIGQWKLNIIDSYLEAVVGALWLLCLALLLAELCLKWKWNDTLIYCIISRNLFYIYLLHDPLEYCILSIFFRLELLQKGGIWVYFYLALRIVGVILISICIGELWIMAKKYFSAKLIQFQKE